MMAKRGISAGRRAWLASELDQWRSYGIVSPAQVASILETYESQTDLDERTSSKAIEVLMGTAAFLVGLGVLLLIGYNWEAMPDALKLAIIFGAILGAYAIAFWQKSRGEQSLSEVIFFLGCLFYGAGIFLIAQIFHLSGHPPDAVWWWALGVLPFALCLSSLLLHALLVALLAIWVGMEILGFGELGMWFFGRWGFVPNGAYSLPVLALPGLVWAYRRNSVFTAGLYILLISWWILLQPVAWDAGQVIVYIVGAVGGLMLVIAECHAEKSPFGITFRLFGVLLVGGVLTLLSFHDFNSEVLRMGPDGRKAEFSLVAVFFVAGAVILAALWKNHSRGQALPLADQVRQLVRRQWLPMGIVLLMLVLMFWQMVVAEPFLPTIAANLAMLALSFWLINLGLREDRGRPFAAGVLYFLLWSIIRYVDLFGDFAGMIGASLMFFLCGGVLFGVAAYWRNRRKLQHA